MVAPPPNPYPAEVPAGLAMAHDAKPSAVEQVKSWLGAHPHVTLGGAIAIGVFLGWIIKRR